MRLFYLLILAAVLYFGINILLATKGYIDCGEGNLKDLNRLNLQADLQAWTKEQKCTTKRESLVSLEACFDEVKAKKGKFSIQTFEDKYNLKVFEERRAAYETECKNVIQ